MPGGGHQLTMYLLITLLPTLSLPAALVPPAVVRGPDTAVVERDTIRAELCPDFCTNNYEFFLQEHHVWFSFVWVLLLNRDILTLVRILRDSTGW